MAKIVRNEPCLCGSGKKYKKCCLLNGVTSSVSNNHYSQLGQMAQKEKEVLTRTLTEEIFQPMRLYYVVYDPEKSLQEMKEVSENYEHKSQAIAVVFK